jgi:periplasmic protein TonB
MLRKLVIIALFAAAFTACQEDKKPTASEAESLPLSVMDTAAAANATLAVSDKELAAAKQEAKGAAAEAKKAAAKQAAADAAKKKAAEAAKKGDKPKPVPAPAKPVIGIPKGDKKSGKPSKDIATPLPTTTENVKKRTGKDDVFIRSEVAPFYLGGEAAMVKYLQKNLKYPIVSKENGVKGTVYVQFVVEKDGKVDDVTVLKGVDNLLNTEAKRVVATMPRWAAGQQNGKAVAVQYVLPVKFELVE